MDLSPCGSGFGTFAFLQTQDCSDDYGPDHVMKQGSRRDTEPWRNLRGLQSAAQDSLLYAGNADQTVNDW